MYRSRVLHGCLALFALAVPAGIASAGATGPDDTATDSTEPAPTAADGTTATTAADGTTAEESGPPNASAPDGTSGDEAVGQPPADLEFQIDMMLGLVPEDEMQEYWAAENVSREQGVQECMNEAGFDYEPQPTESMMYDPYSGMTQLEWAQQYGYGNWTSMDPDNNPYGDQGAMSDWPGDTVNNLSPDEQSAWWGVFDQCQGAQYEASSDPWRNPMVEQIMQDFTTDVENGTRYRDALASWQECMADAGHPFADQNELSEAIWGQDTMDEMMDLQNQFFESEAWLETSPDHAQWKALVDEEIEIAVADATCTPALIEARETVTRDLRDDLVAVWQTIDWSLPPVTYEEIMFPGESVVEEPSGSDVGTTESGASAGTGGEPTETTETPVGLDLGGTPETTEAP